MLYLVMCFLAMVLSCLGATLHVTGPEDRQVEFGDGTYAFATLAGGPGFLNSTVNVFAPDFVTMTGTSVNEMMTLIRDQQATIASQQADIEALKQFVGMMPPPPPPLTRVGPTDDLQAVINEAASGDIIELADGTYTGARGSSGSMCIINNKNLTIRAANRGAVVIDGQNLMRLFDIGSVQGFEFLRVTLEGLKITRGRACCGHVTGYGGAFAVGTAYCCAPDGRSQLEYAPSAPTLILNYCEIYDNWAEAVGGVVYLYRGSLIMDHSNVYSNTAQGQPGGNSGGVIVGGGYNVQVSNSRFSNNRVERAGGIGSVWQGGIEFQENSASFTNCSFDNNYDSQSQMIAIACNYPDQYVCPPVIFECCTFGAGQNVVATGAATVIQGCAAPGETN